jgi:hypothetical protein
MYNSKHAIVLSDHIITCICETICLFIECEKWTLMEMTAVRKKWNSYRDTHKNESVTVLTEPSEKQQAPKALYELRV